MSSALLTAAGTSKRDEIAEATALNDGSFTILPFVVRRARGRRCARLFAARVTGADRPSRHVLVAEGAKLFQDASAPEGMRILYAILESPGQLTHLRDFDTHAPHMFEADTVIMFRADRELTHMEIERAGFVTDVGATTASEA